MPKKPAPAAGGAMPKHSATVVRFPRRPHDPVVAAIEAHKLAAADEREAFDAIMAAIPGTTDAGRAAVLEYVATLDRVILVRVFPSLLSALRKNHCPSEAHH